MTARSVLIVITDQQRADLTAREGYPLDVTPFVDEFARGGRWFRRAYTTSPTCSPARTSLLTGRYPSAHRVTQNAARDAVVAGDDLFAAAREHGCATALIGKNHTYLREAAVDHYVEFSHGGQLTGPRSGDERAFDEWLTGLNHRTVATPAPGGAEVQSPHRIVSAAIDWFDGLDLETPFVAQVSFPEPHNPYQAPEPYFDLFPPEVIPEPSVGAEFLDTAGFAWRHLRRIAEEGEPGHRALIPRARSNYLGMLRFIDDEIARLIGHLDASGRLDDTLVIITSDHGDYFGEYGLMRKGAGVPDWLMRVPFVARGPAVDPSIGPRDECVSLADVFPTVCEHLGIAIPEGVQGASLLASFRDQHPSVDAERTSAYGEQGIGGERFAAADLERLAFVPGLPVGDEPLGAPCFDELNAVTQAGRMRMVRRGRFKLVADSDTGVALYNLDADPGEIVDLAADAQYERELRELLELLAAWQLAVEDTLPLPASGYARAEVRRVPRGARAGF